MESLTAVVLLLSIIAMSVSVSADTGYGKTQSKEYFPQKPVMPEQKHGVYEKSNPKIPTKPLIPKEGHGTYDYEKTNPKMPAKPTTTKEEHEAYKKINATVPAKLVMPKGEHGAYGKSDPKSLLPKVPEHPKNLAVQGLIYCISGSKLIPLEGAIARVTCLAVHKNGYESAPFSFLSCPADKHGYFLAKISPSKLQKDDLWKLTECKAFLGNSPWANCKVPEDTNGGISGARLTSYRLLNGYRLSSVGPFIYNSGHQSSPKEGY